MQPESVFIQGNSFPLRPIVPPDEPYFAKVSKEEDYRSKWQQLLKRGRNVSFLANPKPSYFSDIALNQRKVKLLMDNVFSSDEFEVAPNCVLSLGSNYSWF